MNRRDLISGVASTLTVVLGARRGQSQQPGRIYRLGNLLSSSPDSPHQAALRGELAREGFIEGQNLWIDREGYGLGIGQLAAHAAEIVKNRVDVIVAGGDAAVRAAQEATAEIPVLALTDDMVGQGFVRSLAKPGGNITGVTILAAELDGINARKCCWRSRP